MVLRDPVVWWESLERPLRYLPRAAALALLATMAALMVWSIFATAPVEQAAVLDKPTQTEVASEGQGGDGDLALYRRISERVTAGEGYYAAAVSEQRASNYPVRPFVTVRLPTLAMIHKAIGIDGARVLVVILLLLAVLFMMQRLRGQCLPLERVGAGILLLFGGAAAMTPQGGLIHGVLAGLLLTLALALYDPRRWWPALIAAGLALAVRELAAPFVLLWLVLALMQRSYREAAGVAALLALFGIGLYFHYLGVTAQLLPGDPASPGWDALAGLALPLVALSKLTALLLLPTWLAAPLAILPLLGWLAPGGRLGLFASLWFAGFFLGVALFARPENFYWVQLALPAYFAGFAFVPRAFADLTSAIRGAQQHNP